MIFYSVLPMLNYNHALPYNSKFWWEKIWQINEISKNILKHIYVLPSTQSVHSTVLELIAMGKRKIK